MSRDEKGRPIKPAMIGKAWSPEDLRELTEALVDGVIKENGAALALELLDYGYQVTPMTAQQYDYIKAMIVHRGNEEKK